MRQYLLLLLLLSTHSIFGQLKITGQVIDRTLKTPINNARVYLNIADYSKAEIERFSYEGKDTVIITPLLVRIDSLYTGADGKFSFPVNGPGMYAAEVSHIIDSCILWNNAYRTIVNEQYPEPLTLTIPVYCEYKQYAKQDSCPVCKRKDKCIPVTHGMSIPDPGEDLFDRTKWKSYNMGCMYSPYCHARWYCVRCEKDF